MHILLMLEVCCEIQSFYYITSFRVSGIVVIGPLVVDVGIVDVGGGVWKSNLLFHQYCCGVRHTCGC